LSANAVLVYCTSYCSLRFKSFFKFILSESSAGIRYNNKAYNAMLLSLCVSTRSLNKFGRISTKFLGGYETDSYRLSLEHGEVSHGS